MHRFVYLEEIPPWRRRFGGDGIVPRGVHGKRVVDAAVFKGKREWRDEVVKIQEVYGDEYCRKGNEQRPFALAEPFVRCRAEDENEEPDRRNTYDPAQNEYPWSDAVNDHRHDEYCESEDGKKEQADLEYEATIVMLEPFIRNECGRKDKDKRPTDRDRAGTEIVDEESAEDASEKELKDVDQPEMDFFRILPLKAHIFRKVYKNDTYGHREHMDEHPDVFPEKVNARKGYRIEHETAYERYRRDGPFPAYIPLTDLCYNAALFCFGRVADIF